MVGFSLPTAHGAAQLYSSGNKMRFTECGEYRMLNQSTERDALPLPRTVTFWKPGYQGGGGGGGGGGTQWSSHYVGRCTTLADASQKGG